MIVRNKISRRTLLRGAGGLSLGLPWLEAMTTGTARAATATPIKRLIFFFTPGGQIFDKWRPRGPRPTSRSPRSSTLCCRSKEPLGHRRARQFAHGRRCGGAAPARHGLCSLGARSRPARSASSTARRAFRRGCRSTR